MHSTVRIKSFIALSSDGQVSMKRSDCYDPQFCDDEKLAFLVEKYGDNIIGIKLKQTKDNINGTDLAPIRHAVALASRLGLRVNVHAIDPPCPTAQLIGHFRKGDIFTHVYHGKGSTILDKNGRVLPEVWEARHRGVIFDACNGKNNFDFFVAEAAIDDGFYPDIISSDLTVMTLYKQPAVGLPWILSKYLALGMKLSSVIRAATELPALCMGMAGKIGTLVPGAYGDVAIFKEIDHKCIFADAKGSQRIGNRLLLPQATIVRGQLVYRQLNF